MNMKKVMVAVYSLMVAACFGREVTGKTYQFEVPEGASFKVHERLEFYTFSWGSGPHMSLLMLNASPVPGSAQTLKPMADVMEVSFGDAMKQRGETSEITKERTEVVLGPFKGIQIQFTIKHETGLTIRQYMLLLHDGDRIWNGQLTAQNAGDLEKAQAILKSAKKIGKTDTGE